MNKIILKILMILKWVLEKLDCRDEPVARATMLSSTKKLEPLIDQCPDNVKVVDKIIFDDETPDFATVCGIDLPDPKTVNKEPYKKSKKSPLTIWLITMYIVMACGIFSGTYLNYMLHGFPYEKTVVTWIFYASLVLFIIAGIGVLQTMWTIAITNIFRNIGKGKDRRSGV